MEASDTTKIERWLEQATKEIILSEPGTDRSQLPLHNLFSSLIERSATCPELASFHACATHAGAYLEEILFSGQTYTEAQLERLGALAEELASLLRDPARAFTPPDAATVAGVEQPRVQTASMPAPALAAASVVESEDSDTCAPIDPLRDGDLLREFATESHEHLENIEQGVLILEDNPTDADTLNSIFRAFHTFKGGSGFLNLGAVNRLSHELENLLDSAREGRLRITSAIINLILESGDALKRFVEELERQLDGRKPIAPIPLPAAALIARARALLENPEGDDLEDVLGAPSKPRTASGEAAAELRSASSVIKVDTRKFDALVDLVGELVIAQSLVSEDAEMQRLTNPQLARNLSQLHRITNELQKTSMSLRMVPIRNTFRKMNRLVRDLCTTNGKDVELVIQGEDTEMDRTIVEELADPIMHMIRNSADHGIEKPADRVAAGKPATGRITLSAAHQGGNIVIGIADDGAGLHAGRIFQKAVERGIVAPDAQLSEKEIFELIFAAGFSTAQQVTSISGRGVGMDVVKRNVSRLRGKIEIQSAPGEGTTFKIFLPLTLAIINGLVVCVGPERYIIPTLSVRESFRPTPEMISTVYERGEMVNVRGKLRPMLRLSDYFGVTPRTSDPTQALVVVVESAHQERCVLVDDLIGQQEVVIKSLDEQFKSNRALAGAAILGDGRVGLILEPHALVELEQSSLVGLNA